MHTDGETPSQIFSCEKIGQGNGEKKIPLYITNVVRQNENRKRMTVFYIKKIDSKGGRRNQKHGLYVKYSLHHLQSMDFTRK